MANYQLNNITVLPDTDSTYNQISEIATKHNANMVKINTALTDKITQVALKSSLPTTPDNNDNLYIVYGDTTANNGQYRWNGSLYEKVSTQLDYATQTEAETGTNTVKVMTPLRTFQAIAKWITTTTVSALNTTAKTISGAINELYNNKLDKTGDAKDTTVTFTESITREDLVSGDKSSVLWGKVKKWFTDLKTIAFSGHSKDVAITDTNSKYTSENVDGALDEIGQQLEQKADKTKTMISFMGRSLLGTTILDTVVSLFNTGQECGSMYCHSAGDNPPNEQDVGWKVITWRGSIFDPSPIQVTFESLKSNKTYKRWIVKSGSAFIWENVWKEQADTDKVDNLFESGVWTPTVVFGTTVGTTAYQIQRASYKRIEKFVYCQFLIRFTNTGGTGDIRISSLPIAPKNLENVGIINNIVKQTTNLGMASLSNTQTYSAFNIYKNTGVLLQGSEINDGSQITISGSIQYEIA